jgi:hypothetical protein
MARQDYYTEPTLFTFTQVFIDPDKRGDATLDDAESIKAVLIANGENVEDVSELGDSLMIQNYYPEKDQAEIQKQFGSGFAESLVELSPGLWHGPVLSGYGVHLVYVHNIVKPPAIAFEEVRQRVTLDWETEKGIELNDQFYKSLREQYTVDIEEPAVENNVANTQRTKP